MVALSVELATILCAVLVLLAAAASFMLWRGKWTFLITGYRKFDPETTDLTKVHHSNSVFLSVICVPTVVLCWLGLLLDSAALKWISVAWLFALLIVQIIYEKTDNRFAKKANGGNK